MEFKRILPSGITFIELLVVIAVVGVLAGVALVTINPVRQIQKARDAQRKADLETIHKFLELYYNNHGRYPQPRPDCPYGLAACYAQSSSPSAVWIPDLAKYTSALPKDPINNTTSEGPWTTGNYSYSYGNLDQNGQTYDLTAQLENPDDPDRCYVKDWLFKEAYVDPPYHWCTHWGGQYSDQIYEHSPPQN